MSTELSQAKSRRNGRLVVGARMVSDFGAFLNMVALSTYVYLLSNSAVAVGWFLACRVAGGVFASLVGTPFYRRWPGKVPLIAFDFLRAGLLLLLLILAPAQQLAWLPLIAFGVGLGNSMFAIGLNSQMPCLVRNDQRADVNGWVTSAASTGAVAGSLVSGLVVAGFGYSAVIALNVATYLLAAMFIIPLHMHTVGSAVAQRAPLREDWHRLVQALRLSPVMAGMLLVTLADTLGSAAHNVGFPILSKLVSPDSASTTMGLLLATWAVGKFAGARLASLHLRTVNPSFAERSFFVGVALMSGGFILVFQQQTLPWLLLLALPAGLGDGLAEVALLTRLQQEPDSLRLPVFSLLTLLQMTGFGVGMMVAAPFYGWWSPAVVIGLFHGIPLAAVAWVCWRNSNWLALKT